jgi:serine/threonine-protein kinase
MPEAMAMLKLKGFIHDLGGEVVESEPGRIQVRLRGAPPKTAGSWLRWFGGGSPETAPQPGTDIELHMERLDARQSNRLMVTLLLRPEGAPATPQWRDRCQRIARDLQAYLMGR